MGQEVADAGDLPLSKLNELSEFLAELDAGRPGGEVHLTEQQDRIAEVANLLRPILDAFPSLAVELAPRLARALMTSEDGGLLSLKTRLDRGVPLDVGIELDQKRVEIIGVPRRDGPSLTVSTFSSDIARAVPRALPTPPLLVQSGHSAE